MTESSLKLWFVYIILCLIFFIAGILIAIFSKVERKSGIKMIIYSVIAFIIGFGGCLTYLYFNPFRI